MGANRTRSGKRPSMFAVQRRRPTGYFLHISEMEKAGLNEPAIGDRLEFDVQVQQKGRRAVNVEAA